MQSQVKPAIHKPAASKLLKRLRAVSRSDQDRELIEYVLIRRMPIDIAAGLLEITPPRAAELWDSLVERAKRHAQPKRRRRRSGRATR